MIIGPRYKIARRLGVPVFEKTQTQKYALRSTEKAGNKSGPRPRAKSDYGLGLLEKQRARFSYGITSKQFGNYVKAAVAGKGNSSEALVVALESRLDNVALRSGFAPTRQAARQMVSHGHLTVNGKSVTIPSYKIKIGDKVGIKASSSKKALFATLDERLKTHKIPAWLKLNADKRELTVDGVPRVEKTELLFSPGAVLEFYSR